MISESMQYGICKLNRFATIDLYLQQMGIKAISSV